MTRYLPLLLLLVVFSPIAVTRDSPSSSDEIAELRQKAEAGDSDTQFRLALKNLELKKYAEALKWFRRAAEQGDGRAQYSVGWMYKEGYGTPKNYAEAVKWFRRAATQGEDGGQWALGNAYQKGIGVPKSETEAYFWFNLSASQGNYPAKLDRDDLEKKMSPEQIAEAQRRSAAWKPKVERP